MARFCKIIFCGRPPSRLGGCSGNDTGLPVNAAAMFSTAFGAGSGRPIVISTSTSRQRSMPSMALKCATSMLAPAPSKGGVSS